MSDKEPPKLCEGSDFATVLNHAVAISHEILDACEGDYETMANSTVSVTADFLYDLTEMLISYSVIYEDFDPSEIEGFLDLQKQYATVFGKSQSIH